MLALSVDGQGRSGSGGDIFIASPPNPPPSHMLAGPNSKSGLWPPIHGTKYARHSHLNNGRGLLNERQMAELGAYSFDRIANLRERQRDGERQLWLLTCQRMGAGRVEI